MVIEAMEYKWSKNNFLIETDIFCENLKIIEMQKLNPIRV